MKFVLEALNAANPKAFCDSLLLAVSDEVNIAKNSGCVPSVLSDHVVGFHLNLNTHESSDIVSKS